MTARRAFARLRTGAPRGEAGPTKDPARDQARSPSARSWNLWELERLAERRGRDARAEERTLLLLHLREFADASGGLPAAFDSLVREAFGPELAALAS